MTANFVQIVTAKAAVCLGTLIYILGIFCPMWVKICIRNVDIFLSSDCNFSRKSVPGWPYFSCGAQFKLYLRVYRERLWYLQNKIRLWNVRYVTHCVLEIFFSFIVKVPLEKTWCDSCAAYPVGCTQLCSISSGVHTAVQHIQWRAHSCAAYPVAYTHTLTQAFMICYQKTFL